MQSWKRNNIENEKRFNNKLKIKKQNKTTASPAISACRLTVVFASRNLRDFDNVEAGVFDGRFDSGFVGGGAGNGSAVIL